MNTTAKKWARCLMVLMLISLFVAPTFADDAKQEDLVIGDGSKTWQPVVRATFPGYAQSMVRLESGPILVAKRYPLYSINVSRDDGVNWDAGTVIDYPVWAMGCLVEVEPDVALCIYMNSVRTKPLLSQLIRVTPEGIEPVE